MLFAIKASDLSASHSITGTQSSSHVGGWDLWGSFRQLPCVQAPWTARPRLGPCIIISTAQVVSSQHYFSYFLPGEQLRAPAHLHCTGAGLCLPAEHPSTRVSSHHQRASISTASPLHSNSQQMRTWPHCLFSEGMCKHSCSIQCFIWGQPDAAAVTAFVKSLTINDKLTQPSNENQTVTFRLF